MEVIYFRFAYWDVGRCYDTIPSSFYDDRAYTPEGANRWDTERYDSKINSIASTISSFNPPIFGLYGVENEDVVRDIVSRTKVKYQYVHHTIDSDTGLDFALLYSGDIYTVSRSYVENNALCVEGEMGLYTMNFALTNSHIPHIQTKDVDLTLIAGEINHKQLTKADYNDLMLSNEFSGRGSASSKKGWYMRHRIGRSNDSILETKDSSVHIEHQRLNEKKTAPQPTFTSQGYVGGCSPYLPISTVISCEFDLEKLK